MSRDFRYSHKGNLIIVIMISAPYLNANVIRLKFWFNRQLETENDKIVVGIVACGDRPLDQSIVLLKSILITSIFHGLPSLDAILFADDEHLHSMDLKVPIQKFNNRPGRSLNFLTWSIPFTGRSLEKFNGWNKLSLWNTPCHISSSESWWMEKSLQTLRFSAFIFTRKFRFLILYYVS